MPKPIPFLLNDREVRPEVDPNRHLLWVLRTELGLTGTKFGCGKGICGACTVLLDGRPVRSCQLPMGSVRGRKIVTVEGLEKDGELHPVQTAFMENDALQCGYCTSGMIMSAVGLLNANPEVTRDEIVTRMNANLCRCGAHKRIVEAIESAATEMRKGVPTT